MPIRCPQCSQLNPDQSGFCVRCGNRLQFTGQSQPTPNSSSLPTFSGDATNSLPSYTPPSPFPSGAGSPPPSFPTASQWQTGVVAPPGTQIGTAQGMASIRRAFAGHGTLVAHHSWLLSGSHAYAGEVRNATRDKILQRGIVKLQVTPKTLMERGLLMEERD